MWPQPHLMILICTAVRATAASLNSDMGQQSRVKLGTRAAVKHNQAVPAAFSSRFFCRLAIRRASSRDFSRAFRLAFLPLQHCSHLMSVWQACHCSLSYTSLHFTYALAACLPVSQAQRS